MEVGGGGKHFVLVHGLCHGAWSWYKVATALESAGHRVTALDLAAAGAHPARLHEVRSFEDYSRPLLDAVAAAPDGDRLVKIAAAVFVAAALPCVGKHMGVTTEEVRTHACAPTIVSSSYSLPNWHVTTSQ
jgi:alpha-beta hydrolase superfamily lysophospholipase